MSRPKLKDIAERAGVSAMTVSLALRDGGSQRMAPETLERVRRAAEELNYSPNARARALRLGKTNVIGLYAGHGFVNVRMPFFTEIVSGLQEGCEDTRRDLLLHGVFHGSSPDDLYRELADGRIDGLVVSMPAGQPLAQKFAASRLPVIAIADALPDLPSVVVDDGGGTREIVHHLHARGHRRIDFVMSPAQPVSAQRRRDAFLAECDALGIRPAVRPLQEGDPRGFVRDSIALETTALVCWNDGVALSLLQACADEGVSVPSQMAIVGFDGITPPVGFASPLTTVVAPWAEAARQAVHLLDAVLQGKTVPGETTLPVRFAQGTTT